MTKKTECIWLDDIESFPAYCITHRCGEAKRCGLDGCPHCSLTVTLVEPSLCDGCGQEVEPEVEHTFCYAGAP